MFADAITTLGSSLERRAWSALASAVAWVVARLRAVFSSGAPSAARVGPYALEDEIGRGGMGVVYRATHAASRRRAAVKMLASDATLGAAQRFDREVAVTARLRHPNTVAVLDHGRTRDGAPYYAMEYVDGVTLEDLVEREGPLPAGRVVHVVLQICAALAAAHAQGVVHRDVKPANVMLTDGDLVKVLDFGLVKDAHADGALTGTAILGTPHYMAPEAIVDPAAVDARADLYGVGAVAYFLLTGERVFDGANLVEICRKHLYEAPAPPSSRGAAVPPALEDVVLACLAKDPAERPRDAAALAALLTPLRPPIPSSSPSA